MCGIAGYFDPSPSFTAEEARAVIERMSRTILHRGPDDGGCFTDVTNGVALTNRRLAVVDLSPQGHQPMESAEGRYVIAFNGEIYNHADLRAEVAKARGSCAFRGHSDTETLLEAITCWGVRETLRRSVGMFALALWDRSARSLILARDRLGEKPLYYGWSNGVFVFGSELKALRVHPRWKGEIDRDAEALYFRFGYVPGPGSIYAGIGKLPPGTIAYVNDACGDSGDPAHPRANRILCDPGGRVKTRLESYWTAGSVPKSYAERLQSGDGEARAQLDSLLRRTISRQMLADVPVGTLLSGGVDSSLVAAIAQAESTHAVRTFTIGFEERAYNESEHAEAVARHLGTDHTTFMVSPRDALDTIPNLPCIYDEPFADTSGIPTYLVSQLARSQVTVALSGDGGDEIFGGYNRHYWVEAFWRQISVVPRPIRRVVSEAILLGSPEKWDAALSALAKVSPSLFRHAAAGEKMHKLADILPAKTPMHMNEILATDRWPAKRGTTRAFADHDCPDWLSLSEQVMFMDLQTYLPDDILVKVDRAAMAVSLETRAPYLDHEIVEFAWSLPPEQKIRAKTGKWLLREILYRYVPKALFDRPKMGFEMPIGDWLRGPLRDWAESLLTDEKLDCQQAVDRELIRRRWDEHLSGRRNWTQAMWCLLMYQSWLDRHEAAIA